MNKQDFLDILRDYLKGKFSEDEIEDIIRDYEEHFVEGAIEGKIEMDIISALGSPKSIAEVLLEENGVKVKTKASKVKLLKARIQDKFKINLNDANHVDSRKKVKAKKVLVTLIVSPIALGAGFITVCSGIGLVGSVLGGVALIPFANSFAKIMPELASTTIFGGIAFVGLEILIWQLFINIVKFESRMLKKYRNWMGLTNKYINASEMIEEAKREEE